VHRLALFLIMLALLAAPYGRAQAQAAAVPHAPMAMAGHCEPAGPAAPAPAHDGSIDCMIACASVPAVEAELAAFPLPPVAEPLAAPVAALSGILPQFDPPPPRLRS
jgi:hypothetical protein